MAVGDQQVLHEVLLAHAGRRPAAPAAPLRLVGVQGLSLGVALVGDGHHQVLHIDEVLYGQVLLAGENLGAPLVAVGVRQGLKLLADDFGQAPLVAEDFLQFGDFVEHALVVLDQLVLLQGGQPVQAQVQYGLGLVLG